MNIYRDLSNPLPIRNAVVTTGSFDGVHIGHKVILNRLNSLAREINGESVLITFHPHPRKVLFPDGVGKELRLINSQPEKTELLANSGIDNLLILNFTLELSRMSSIEFIRKVLVDKLHTRKVVIGFNHHFGHNREGDYELLLELGKFYNFDVEEIPQQDIDNETVSSTKIRQALIEGRIQRANAYLDHFYIIIGELKKTDPAVVGTHMIIYQVKIDEDVKLTPKEGVYAISAHFGELSFRGMLNIKNTLNIIKPDGHDMMVELHLFDCEYDLHGKTVTINFHKRMRDRIQFVNQQELLKQLESDKAGINELIF